MDIDKWFRVNLEGCFYDDMVGKLVKEEPCTMTLHFSKSIGTATFLKEKLTIEKAKDWCNLQENINIVLKKLC